MSKSRKPLLFLNVVFMILVIVAIFYLFSNHLVLVNTCRGNESLFTNSSSVYCMANSNINLVMNGRLASYTPNSSIAVSGYNLVPLPFKFLGGLPLIDIWNQPANQQANSFAFLTIPDTFKVHMVYNATIPTEFMVMTNTQYVNWVNGGSGTASYVLLATGSHVSVWFNDSTGCAGYVAVIKGVKGVPFTIYPNETILYDPATSATGVCALG